MTDARYFQREVVGDWAAHGSCVGMDPELFFPSVGHIPRKAKEACAGCPVRSECLEHALRNKETIGVWGGTSSRERERLGMRRPRLIAAVPQCGSESGYAAHRRKGEPTCPLCRAAHSTATTVRDERRRA